ncbi:MAG: TetR/AcrR family transcriptional regulator [Anaerohalosphaeraceae bacterium]
MSRHPTETKTRILHSARSLFSNHGFTATSLDDILGATGITKGAFYHYFRSKDHLCEVLLDEVIQEYRDVLKTINGQAPALEQLKQWLSLLIEKTISGQWVNCRLITRLSVQIQQLGPELQTRLTDFWRWYEGLYINWFTQCGLAPRQAALSARTLTSAIFGAIWLDKSAAIDLSMPDVVDYLLGLVLKPT